MKKLDSLFERANWLKSMMNDSLYQNTQQAWTSLHGPFITPKEYEKVPVFGGKEEEEDDDFYDNEFEDKA